MMAPLVKKIPDFPSVFAIIRDTEATSGFPQSEDGHLMTESSVEFSNKLCGV